MINISSVSNSYIRELILLLSDPDKWNHTGEYNRGKYCIVTGLWKICLRDDFIHYSRGGALRAIEKVIKEKYGESRGIYYNEQYLGMVLKVGIIEFNDHKDTSYSDVMEVLLEAEKKTKPFWRMKL